MVVSHPRPGRANCGKEGVSPEPWEREKLTRAAHETCDSRVLAVTSRQCWTQARFALRGQQGKGHFDCSTENNVALSDYGMRSGSCR